MTEKNKINEKEAKVKKVTEKSVFKNHNFWILALSGLLLNLLSYFLLWWQIKPGETAVILHYNSFLGIDVIDFSLKERYYELFIVSFGGTAIWLINSLLAIMLFSQSSKFFKDNKQQKALERVLGGYLLLVSSIIVQLGLLVYVLAIVGVNV